ncbi:hypothetical protein M9Y90_19405 [Leptospira interrogans]|uniref:hypothetical protein n=1 Tax=Leptospira interrogans TaxID=173 RepID=UPI0004AC3FC0|nr:hypothetical protein [Leptospira interrogans]MCL8312804.1 hypothetical protein [Leptospira interrogans]
MKESEYSEFLVYFCSGNLGKFLLWIRSVCIHTNKARENLHFGTGLTQTSPPKSSTSPSKTGTSLPLRLGFAWPSPRGRRRPTLLFCSGLAGVLRQNTSFTLKQCILGRKKFSRSLLLLLLLIGFESK